MKLLHMVTSSQRLAHNNGWVLLNCRIIENGPNVDPVPTPKLRVNHSDNVFISGEIISFECQSNNKGSPSQWTLYKNGQLVPGNIKYGERYSLEATKESTAGSYCCRCEKTVLNRTIVSDYSSSIQISIFDTPVKPSITVRSDVYKGDTVNIYCEVPHIFKATKAFFYKEDELIYTSIAEELKNTSSFNLTIINTNSSNEGNYTCRYETTLSSQILNSTSSEPLFFRVQDGKRNFSGYYCLIKT
ncbi:uncharacterized protein LOC122790509 [Protopterus annectens]|uniref:uncharacterized protein LOC122790509 n=1 Tax=Protopterus annectens TaxID=7888 RepID=UPI001CF9831A|nr:uncharacterized protein LOC122790509 [Protopterus annectens]